MKLEYVFSGARKNPLAQKAERLRAAGWQVGDASDFLELTPEETRLVESKLSGKAPRDEGDRESD
ncbi:MAG: hypothetical protein JJ896_11315 [Rhodothermales bacterium]|nr:hypothetical protein [Rhodothermales bacterium]MBO6780231.1 hypothetical protein [Rhodothermales bacterium]